MHPFWRSLGRATLAGFVLAGINWGFQYMGWASHPVDIVDVGWWSFVGALCVLPLNKKQARSHAMDYYE